MDVPLITGSSKMLELLNVSMRLKERDKVGLEKELRLDQIRNVGKDSLF